MRLIPIIYCAALTAQVPHLSTDYLGSAVYFAGTFRLNASDLPHSKIFRWDATNGLHLWKVRQREWLPEESGGGAGGSYFQRSNYYRLESPSVSRDGSRIAFVGRQDWTGCWIARLPNIGLNVAGADGASIVELTRNEDFAWHTETEISASGKALVRRTTPSPYEGCGVESGKCVFLGIDDPYIPLRDVKPHSWGASRQTITSEGYIARTGSDYRLRLYTPAVSRPMGNTIPAMAPVINPAATVVVFERVYEDGVPRCLYSLDAATGQETLLFVDADMEMMGITEGTSTYLTEWPYPSPQVPKLKAAIDETGDQVLVLAKEAAGLPRQWLFLIHSDGSEGRWLAYTPEGYREAVLSGDGRVIFAVTESGRLVRVDATTEEVTEIVPRTPWIGGVRGAAWSGARNRILGGGFSTETCVPEAYPAPDELCGVRVELNGTVMPLLSVSPNEIQYQVPWAFGGEMNQSLPQTLKLRVSAASDSPLIQPEIDYPYPSIPKVEQILHDDGTLVGPLAPVKRGQYLRIRYTGFDGPRGATGVPGEDTISGPPPACRFGPDYLNPPQSISFGLLKGVAGVFELRFRVPPDLKLDHGSSDIYCDSGQETRNGVQVSFPVAE